MLGQEIQNVDYKELINNISQEEVFQSLLGYYPNLYQKVKSPFRSDKTPGCRFEWKNGYLCLVENTKYKNRLYWNIFYTCMELNSCTFAESVRIISKGRYKGISKPVYKDKLTIRFTYDKWEDSNLFNLPNDILIKEHTFLVKDYWAGRNGYWKKNFYSSSLCIAYHFPETDRVKLYFPETLIPEEKWYSNCTNNEIFGYSSLDKYGDLLIITKSQKDRLTLKYHYLYNNVIAVQNEGCYIPDNIVQDLKLRFKQIIIIFDNDATGLEKSKLLAKKYGFENRIIRSEFKDPYEMYINKQTIKIV